MEGQVRRAGRDGVGRRTEERDGRVGRPGGGTRRVACKGEYVPVTMPPLTVSEPVSGLSKSSVPEFKIVGPV